MTRPNTRARGDCTKKPSVCKGVPSQQLGERKSNQMIENKKPSKQVECTESNKSWIAKNNQQLTKSYLKEKLLNRHGFKVSRPILSTNGRIKKISKNSVKMFDKILKSELMIQDSSQDTIIDNTSEIYIEILPEPTYNNEIINDISSPEPTNNNEIINGISSPESLDSNSNRIKRSNTKKPKDTPKQTKQKPKKTIKPKKESKKIETKQVTFTNVDVFSLSFYLCDHCGKKFENKSSLRRHIMIHLGVKPYSCKYCTRKFGQVTNLKKHVMNMHNDNRKLDAFVCKECDKPFDLKENLELHLHTHPKPETSYKCIFCNKVFKQQILLSQHEKIHLVSGRYHCAICNTNYDCRARLVRHVKGHLNIKDYVCQHCGKDFLRANSLRRHIGICHTGYRLQCPVCFKHFKGHLAEHIRTHENEKPHQCPDCGQQFRQSTQLTVHRRSHSGVKPYPCQICEQRFSHSNALKLHIRRHTGEKPFGCALCPLAFSQLPHMKAHMKKIHGKEAPYKCQKCNEFFKLKAQLESHGAGCKVGGRELGFEGKLEASPAVPEKESPMGLSRMRFLLALLLTMIATKVKLKYLGFNKRLIDDVLIESLEAMGQPPCRDRKVTPLCRLRANIQILLNKTIPAYQMDKLKKERKSTEELLELLTGEKAEIKRIPDKKE